MGDVPRETLHTQQEILMRWEHEGTEHRLVDDRGVILAKVYECSDGLLFTDTTTE